MIEQAVNHLKRLHQIPCDKCVYFTGDYRLKCTVNPLAAMSETAIGCRDFSDQNKAGCSSCLALITVAMPIKNQSIQYSNQNLLT